MTNKQTDVKKRGFLKTAFWSAIALNLLLASTASASLLITKSNTTLGVVDGGSAIWPIEIAGADITAGVGTIQSVTVTVGFTKCSNLGAPLPLGCSPSNIDVTENPFFNEISFSLSGPSGTTVSLVPEGFFDIFGFFTGSVTMTFDDLAATSVPTIPANGTFEPFGSLSDFAGENAIGFWGLTFADSLADDPLQLESFSLSVTTSTALEIAGPSVLGSFVAGLAGLGLFRRQRRRPAP